MFRRVTNPKRVAGVSVIIALAAAIAVSAATAAGSASARFHVAAATPPAGLLGNYATTLTGKEHFHFPGASRLTPGSPTTGKWLLILSRTSATVTHLPDRFTDTRRVTYARGRVTFAASTGCDFNLSPVTPGVYTYRLSGRQLRFRVIRDSCLDRAGLMTGEPWHRQ